MAGELIRVPFYDDVLDAVQDGNKVWVSLRRCCENLGLDPDGQRRKLKGKAWACTEEMSVQMPGSDQTRTVLMVDLETLPGWLFSVDARKVAEHVREKLARYQREAAKVLATHFLRMQGGLPVVVSAATAQLEKLLGRVDHLQQQLDRLASAQIVAPAVPRFTVRQRLDYRGLNLTKKARRRTHKIAVGLTEQHSGEPLCQAGGTGGGGPTYWTAANIIHLDFAIDHVLKQIEAEHRREREAGRNIFNIVDAA